MLDAIREREKAPLADADAPGGAEVQAKAQFALDITPKRFRLIALAAVRLPLRLINPLRGLLAELLRLLF